MGHKVHRFIAAYSLPGQSDTKQCGFTMELKLYPLIVFQIGCLTIVLKSYLLKTLNILSLNSFQKHIFCDI